MGYKHDYFIIESLQETDVKDGKIFYDAINSIKNYDPIYRKVHTKRKFKNALVEFSNSEYRYLFISAHGDEENIILTKESFNAYDIQDDKINLQGRRIFMSTCRGGSFLIAKYFILQGAYSIVGCPDDLAQIVANAMWPTMVCILERYNEDAINYAELNNTLRFLVNIYHIELRYYSFLRNKCGMKEYIYSNGQKRKKVEHPFGAKPMM